jgi:hypothetical protein
MRIRYRIRTRIYNDTVAAQRWMQALATPRLPDPGVAVTLTCSVSSWSSKTTYSLGLRFTCSILAGTSFSGTWGLHALCVNAYIFPRSAVSKLSSLPTETTNGTRHQFNFWLGAWIGLLYYAHTYTDIESISSYLFGLLTKTWSLTLTDFWEWRCLEENLNAWKRKQQKNKGN